MKNLIIISFVAVLFSACNSDKLDRETALKLFKEQKEYPKIVEEEIYIADPEEAKRIMDLGLEKNGFLSIEHTQSLNEVGKPLISFTDKSKAFLLPLTENDKKNKVQRVKIAEEVIEEITGIQILEGGKNAVVEYRTAYKNITPFSKLARFSLADNNIQKAHFSLYEDGWRMENKSVR